MATSTVAFSPTAVRSFKFESLWLVLGLTAAVIPLFLIWQHLGSHFAGGDGKMYQTLVETYVRFGQWGMTIMHNPLEGAWNVGIPINVWINPALLPFSFLPAEQAKIWTGAICYIVYAVSWYLVLRSAGAPLLRSIVVAQLAFVAFDPFYYVYGWPVNMALVPWASIMIALTLLIACVLLRINKFSAWTIIGGAAAVAIIVIYGIELDTIYALVIFTTSTIPLAVVACERGLRPATAARWLTLLLAFFIVLAAGPGRYVLTMSHNTSRYIEPALTVFPQIPLLASTVFQYSGVKYIYAVMIVGWALGLVFCRGRVRLLPLVAAIAFAAQVIFVAFFLLADVSWIIPIPLSFQTGFTPWYILGAGVGYGAGLWAVLLKVSKLWPKRFAPSPEMFSVGRVVGSLLCLSLVPGYLTYTRVNVADLHAIVEPWSSQDMADFLAKRLSLLHDSHFRGSAVITLADYTGALTQDSLWRAFVPTLNEYSELVTEQLFVMLHELLVKGNNEHSGNHYPLYSVSTPGWLKSYMIVTSALGARFVVSPTPLDFSAAIPPGTASLKEVQFPIGRTPGHWHVYELPVTNTGNYSPTVLYKLATAPEMLEKMASPGFDFRNDAVVTEEIGERLVPLKEMSLSFERGAARVQGTSDGTSLALLPLQYSHCLRISDPNARLVRTDLAMLGLVFKGHIDAKITDDFGTFTPGCRAADNADISRLKMALTPLDFSPEARNRPNAVKSVADFIPTLLKILRQIK